MDWFKKNYDRALVIIFGAAALLVSGYLIFRAMNFRAGVELAEATPGSRLEPLSDELVGAALTRLKSFEPWVRPKLGAKKIVPLYVSTPFVVMNDQPLEPFDMMAEDAQQLRPPIENWWLVENNLNYTSIDVKQNDPDRDNFTNLDEWEAKTDPNNPLSKPTFITKLYYAERLEEPLSMRLSFYDASNRTAAIAFMQKDEGGQDQRRTHMLPVGGSTPDGRFRLLNVAKETVEKFGTPTNVDVATVLDTRTDKAIRLEQGTTIDHPTYVAKIVYTLTNTTYEKKAGEDFELSVPLGTTITVNEIHPDHIVISYVPPGETELVKEKKDLRPPPQ